MPEIYTSRESLESELCAIHALDDDEERKSKLIAHFKNNYKKHCCDHDKACTAPESWFMSKTTSTTFTTYFLKAPGSYYSYSDFNINHMEKIIRDATKFIEEPIQKFAVVFQADNEC